jgi:hypothetical protein
MVLDNLQSFWPAAVSASGGDFALVVDDERGRASLVRRGGVTPWDAGIHAYARPVFVGDALVTVERADPDRLDRYVVKREGEVVFSLDRPEQRIDEPVKSLWSWQGHWVLEFAGQVFVDGSSLGEQLGYAEVFDWRLVAGQPFYFFRQADRIGVSYAGQVLVSQYDEVVHYRCCEPAAFNVQGNDAMVWFHARRGDTWLYVEAGVFSDARSPAQ